MAQTTTESISSLYQYDIFKDWVQSVGSLEASNEIIAFLEDLNGMYKLGLPIGLKGGFVSIQQRTLAVTAS